MTKIVVDDNELDLYPETLVQTNLKSIDIGDITKRFVSFTNSIKIPLTEKNQRSYGLSQLKQSQSTIPYLKRTCKVIQNGVELISNGQEKLNKIGREITTTIYGNTFDFYEKINNKMLYDLDLSSLNAVWRDANIGDYCDVTTGLVSPVMDYGDYNYLTNDINTATYLPSIYYHTIIQRIFTDAGYTISGSILSNNRYLKLIQPYSRDRFEYARGLVEDYKFIATKTVSQTFTNPSNVTITFPNETLDPKSNYDGTSTYTSNWSIGLLMHFYAELSFFASGAGTTFTAELVVNGSVVASKVFTSALNETYLLDSRILFPLGVSMPGDSRTALVRVSGTNSNTSGFTAGKFYNEPLQIPLTENGSGTRSINFGYLLPEIKQEDYIKDFYTRFGLIPYESNGNILLKSINEVITDRWSALDFTALAARKASEVSFFPLIYASVNKFKYQIPDDVNNDVLGQGSFTLSNFPYSQPKDIFTTFFNATANTNFGVLYCATIPAYKRTGALTTVSIFNAGAGYTNGTYANQDLTGGTGKDATADIVVAGGVITTVTIKSKGTGYRLDDRLSAAIPGGANLSIQVTKTDSASRLAFDNKPLVRLLAVRDKRTNEPNVLYNGVSKTSYKVAYFVDDSETIGCSFQSSIDNDYSLLVDSLRLSKVEKKQYNFNEVDISKITPHTLIFDTDAYYLINSVKFIPGELSDVEIFKV